MKGITKLAAALTLAAGCAMAGGIEIDGLDLKAGGEKIFLKGVVWDAALANEGESAKDAIERLKESGVNAIETDDGEAARAAEEAGVYVISGEFLANVNAVADPAPAEMDDAESRTEKPLVATGYGAGGLDEFAKTFLRMARSKEKWSGGSTSIATAGRVPRDAALAAIRQLYTAGRAAADFQSDEDKAAIVNARLLSPGDAVAAAEPPELVAISGDGSVQCVAATVERSSKQSNGERWWVSYRLAGGGSFAGWTAAAEDGTLAYNLAADDAAKARGLREVGLAVKAPAGAKTVSWLGSGVWPDRDGYGYINTFGYWTLDADDARLAGPRGEAHYVECGGVALVSGTGRAGAWKIDGAMRIAEFSAAPPARPFAGAFTLQKRAAP